MASFEEVFFKRNMNHALVEIFKRLKVEDVLNLARVNKTMRSIAKDEPEIRKLVEFSNEAVDRKIEKNDLEVCLLACKMDNLHMVKIYSGPLPKRPLIEKAVENGRVEIVRYLINDCRFDLRAKFGGFALIRAAWVDYSENMNDMIRFLLDDLGVDPHLEVHVSPEESYEHEVWKFLPLYGDETKHKPVGSIGAFCSHKTIKWLIERGTFSLNDIFEDAANMSVDEMVQEAYECYMDGIFYYLLLNTEFDNLGLQIQRFIFHRKCEEDIITVMEFAMKNDLDLFVALLDRCGALEDGLHFALGRCNIPAVKRLLDDKMFHVNVLDEEGHNLLMRILSRYTYNPERMRMTEFLIDSGISVNHQSNSGMTAMHAASLLSVKEVELLLHHGASVTITNSRGQTPVHWFCLQLSRPKSSSGDIALLRKLLQADASVIDLQDTKGRTALHILLSKYLPDIGFLKLFIEYGADLNLTDIENRTPLRILCDVNNLPINNETRRKADFMLFLIEYGAELDA